MERCDLISNLYPLEDVHFREVGNCQIIADHAVHEGVQDQHEKIALFSESVQVKQFIQTFS